MPLDSDGIKTEVIDLSENPADIPSSCSGIGDFPFQIVDAVGGNVKSRQLICGGEDANYKATNDCFELIRKTWRLRIESGKKKNHH